MAIVLPRMLATILSRGDSLRAFSEGCHPTLAHSFSFHSFAATDAATDVSWILKMIAL